jgi:hypothetical protein
MFDSNLAFDVSQATRDFERITIHLNGRPTGEATILYGDATATVEAQLRLEQVTGTSELPRLHEEFSSELLAFIADRGAMAQEAEGQITYNLGLRSIAIDLPTNREAGLGYPNSW